jgi:hypothetical protein
MFNWIDKAYQWLSGKVDSVLASWVHDVVRGFWYVLNALFGNVTSAWSQLKDIFDFFGSKIERYFNETYRAISDAYNWINTRGYLVYYYITHPAKLVDLLWEALIANLESTAWETADRLGKFFLSLFLRNLEKFLMLIEDILNAVL